MVKIVRRNIRSRIFLTVSPVAAVGLSGALSLAAPTASQSNNDYARTNSHSLNGCSSTKAPAVCWKRCNEDFGECMSGLVPLLQQCNYADDRCLKGCKR